MGFGTCSALDTRQDVRFGRLALVGVVDGKDESGAVKPVEVARSFEAETLVGASYDDGLVCELVRGIQWGDEELLMEEDAESCTNSSRNDKFRGLTAGRHCR
jgi:hypothetical protein